MKLLKYVLIGLGVLILVAGALLGYVAATFDPNAYKPQIVQAVKERTQRTLSLEGDVNLTVFPSLGVHLGKATLSERGSDKPFAAIGDLRVAVKLLPLLSHQVVVDAINIKGLQARLVRFKDGSTNFADLVAAPPPPSPAPQKGPASESPPFTVDIAHIRIADTAVTFVDQADGTQYELSKLNLATGRIADGVPTDIEISARARAKQEIDLEVALRTRASYAAGSEQVRMEGLDFSAKGSAAGFSDLVATAKGDISARPPGHEFSASGFTATVSGKRGEERLDLKIALPKLALTREHATGQNILVDGRLEGGKRKLVAKVEIPAIEGRADAFRAKEVRAAVETAGEGPSVQLKLASPLSASVGSKRFELAKLTASARIADPQWPKSPVDASLNGALAVDAAKETAALTFEGKFDESAIDGRVGLVRFTPPSYVFDLRVDKLDADRYAAKAESKGPVQGSGAAQSAPGGQSGGAAPPIDLAALKELNAKGTLRVGSLKFSNLKATNVRLDVKAGNGKVDVSPLTANLYEGALSGALSAEAAATPLFVVRQKLTGVSIGPLLADLAGNDTLEGKGNVTVDLKAHGQTVPALKKSLEGNMAVDLRDGAVKGVDIAGTIRGVTAKLGTLRGETVQQADRTQKTDFTEMKATFTVKNGVAHNEDLSIKSPLLRIGGAGDIDIGADRLDYVVKASIVATTEGQAGRDLAQLRGVTVPVKVSGPIASPSYKLDFNALATETAKRKLEDTVKREVEKKLGGGSSGGGSGGLADKLKGLFGR